MEIVEKVVMVSINETLIVELISFLIFLFLINRIMFRPLNSTMQARSERMDTLGKEIETARQTISDLQKQMDEQEKQAIDEANRQRLELENDGEKQAKSVLEESKKDIREIKIENQRFVNEQITEARKSLQTEAERLATEIMEKILDRRLVRE
ncbi:MAG: ATP synthase F0 subunit B [Desulfosalsimonadaceae bacterium]